MDEDKTEDQVVETSESEEIPPAAATSPQATEEPKDVEDEVESPKPEIETQSDEQTEETITVSRRENKRIQDLTRKLAESQQRSQSPAPQMQVIDEGEYTPEEVNHLARQYGEQQYSAGLAQANALTFATRLELDAPKVASKYEVLDQNSENFDPGVSAFINESYLKTVGYNSQIGTVQNSNIRYEEYVEGMMEVVETLSQGRAADSTKNLVRQAAQTGVRPSSVSKQYSGTDPSKMTLEQLQAAALLEAKAQKF